MSCQKVQKACIKAAREVCQEASMSGLCTEASQKKKYLLYIAGSQ